VKPCTLLMLLFAFAEFASAGVPSGILSGGDGSSYRKAIVVNARSAGPQAGLDAQQNYLRQHFGQWRSLGTKVVMHDGRTYCIVALSFQNRRKRTVYFDISCCWAAMLLKGI